MFNSETCFLKPMKVVEVGPLGNIRIEGNVRRLASLGIVPSREPMPKHMLPKKWQRALKGK